MRDGAADEARLRSAISRAYYAVFLTTRDRLFGFDGHCLTRGAEKRIRNAASLQKRQKQAVGGSHEVVIFAASQKSLSLSQQLDQLKEARVIADYRLDPQHLASVGKHSWRDYASDTVALASQVLPAAKNLPRY